MEFEQARPFMETNHRGVITTMQRNGAMQNSIVVCGAYQGNAAFVSVRGNSQKVRNLRREPRCTVMAVDDGWRQRALTGLRVAGGRADGRIAAGWVVADLGRIVDVTRTGRRIDVVRGAREPVVVGEGRR